MLADGQVAIMGVPQRNIALGALAALANPLRGAVQPGTEPGLEATAYFGPAKGATAAGAHAMIIDIDPATMELRILKYVVMHDCGRVINPLIVAGQIHGGVAQGVGNAFYEQLVFDEEGQLINGTLADYLLPTAFEVPRIEIVFGTFAIDVSWSPIVAFECNGAVPTDLARLVGVKSTEQQHDLVH